MNEQPPNPLEYAQRHPTLRRWRWRIVLGALAVVLTTLAITRGPAVWDRAMLLYWQNRCMNYTAPADQVVYDNSPADVEAYLAGGGKLLAEQRGLIHPAVGRVPGELTAYLRYSDIKILKPDECVLFMHGMASPGGTKRLVVVVCSESRVPGAGLPRAVAAYSLGIEGWRGGGGLQVSENNAYRWGVAALSIYAGQPDPADPSHFTIRFKRLHDGLIEGRLADDGQVHLQFRGSKEDGLDLPLEQP